MYINIHYIHMLHCMIKLRPDLESAHREDRFDIICHGLAKGSITNLGH